MSNVSRKNLIKTEIIDWSKDSSSHGLPRIVGSRHRIIRIFWLVLTVISLVLCAYHIAESIQEYHKYEVNTKIRLIKQYEMPMPAVRVCSSYPFTTDAGAQFVFGEIAKQLDMPPSTHYNLTYLLSMIKSKEKMDEIMFSLNQFAYLLPAEQRRSLSFNFSEMFLGCSLGMNNCSLDVNTRQYYDTQFGNCFVLNANKDQVYQVKEDSFNDAIKAFVYLGKFENYFNHMVENQSSFGLVISIMNQSESYMNYDNLIYIEPGTCALIKLRKTISISQPAPYSNCVDLGDDEFMNQFEDTFLIKMMKKANLTYTQADCFQFYKQFQVIKKCGCYTPLLPNENKTVDDCFKSNQTACVYNYFIEQKKEDYMEDCLKYCPLECETSHYERTISTHMYPSPGFTYRSLQSHPTIRKYFGAEARFDELSRSVASFEIRFDGLRYTYMEETPDQTFVQFLSNLGGIVGLFVG